MYVIAPLVLHNVIKCCCWDNICILKWNVYNKYMFLRRFDQPFIFCMYIDFWKKRVKNNQLLQQNVYFNGYINNCRMDFFLKWRKTCCVYIIVMGLGNSGNKPMGSSNRIEFGQAHGRNKIDNIFSMASCPNIINIYGQMGFQIFCRYVMPVSITNELIWVSIFRNKTEFW